VQLVVDKLDKIHNMDVADSGVRWFYTALKFGDKMLMHVQQPGELVIVATCKSDSLAKCHQHHYGCKLNVITSLTTSVTQREMPGDDLSCGKSHAVMGSNRSSEIHGRPVSSTRIRCCVHRFLGERTVFSRQQAWHSDRENSYSSHVCAAGQSYADQKCRQL
jgi:hypothetical protein